MKRIDEIVTDAEIERVHAHANFGPTMTKRDVVDQGVLTYAFGYTSGHTQLQILREHKLVTGKHGYSGRLTKKGVQYLRSLFQNVPLAAILKMAHLNP